MATTIPTKTAHAYIEGDELVLEDFRERDVDVVGFVRDSDEPEVTRPEKRRSLWERMKGWF